MPMETSYFISGFYVFKILFSVLAFTGAPASFPIQLENRELHRYMKWSEPIQKQARDFIKQRLPKGAFIGIHLRNGIDWVQYLVHLLFNLSVEFVKLML
jgi:hypothetical protein